MATRKLNVLVYTGTGTTVESVKHAIYSLRRLLAPNYYAVIPLTEASLLKEPWPSTCALLVFPGGADLGYCRVLNGAGNALISQYVRRGGAYLGFCAGGYYGSKKCEFEVGNRGMEVIGPRELAFFSGTCRGGAFKGFQYNSEKGARAVRLDVKKDAFKSVGVLPDEVLCYYNGGGVFILPPKTPDEYQVLASYAGDIDVDGGEEKAAAVFCRVGQGSAILTGPHPEFAPANLSHQNDVPGYDDLIATLKQADEARATFLKACLVKLGLEVNQETSSVPSLSRIHLSAMDSAEVDDLLIGLEEAITREDGEEYINGENDIFHLEKMNTKWDMNALKKTLSHDNTISSLEGIIDYTTIPKRVMVHDESWPDTKETPYFNHHAYYSNLKSYRETDREAEKWGDYLMYGEVVTSTNTLLEKNYKLLSHLPTGFTLAATTQIAGRGRGNNVWVSPAGALIMSTVINHPAHLAASRPIVFIQYLAAVAIVEAIKSYDKGYGDMPVKLKWPNDIYALDPRSKDDPPKYVKIGGILSNCAYSSGAYQIVLGIGINTTNGRPTTSLDALLPSHLPPFRIEKLLARILTRIEVLYNQFVRRGFTEEMERNYYAHWLHGRQIVTLEAEGGVRARIVGITRDWGMLRAEELNSDDRPTGKMWALQSDENSFDFFKGLVRRKV
ncbi:biotin-protein ligase [Truncatella angustata]|uniref:Biotin-protein ligase n=1 Tax=Truncatella angustata TaxID=152316 RepID=A0A9P8RP67_9PEZI|nr:biotin-protein ligase [Truncatella angustata]KAH6647805.1 biotin-protein ligase [Truncatella angustata]